MILPLSVLSVLLGQYEASNVILLCASCCDELLLPDRPSNNGASAHGPKPLTPRAKQMILP